MFTGIVEEVGTVSEVRPGGLTFGASRVMPDLAVGGSISVNGACLTVTSRDDATFTVDVVPETLRRTNLGALEVGGYVNLERPLAVSARLDGHIVQGHVDGTGAVEAIALDGEASLLSVKAPAELMRYVVEKGFIAVDGTSLTVVNCVDGGFQVAIIPHTRENTVFAYRKVGDPVNLEVDILAKYVERLTSASL